MRRVTRTKKSLVEKRSRSERDQFQSAAFLNEHYFEFQRELAYPESRDLEDWKRWRRKLRGALRKTLCLDELGKAPTPRPAVEEEIETADYIRQKVVYETFAGSWVSAYLLIPSRGPERKPAVICPHGHVRGAKEGVVNPEFSLGAAYGHELARRGAIVLAPDNAGMGERDVCDPDAGERGCRLVWFRLNQMGLDLTGFRVFDLMAGINLLTARNDVDGRRIGCAGLSGGCWLSQVLTALDRRIKAVILSGFFTTFVQTAWHGHCICHHPFGIGRICDMPDISALIAPRPQFVESGISDAPYPHEPAFGMVRNAYELLDAGENLGLHRYRGGHMFHGGKSIPWLMATLGMAE